jgi:hypothetical protein
MLKRGRNNNSAKNKRPAKRTRTVANRAASIRRNSAPGISRALLRAQVYQNILQHYPGLTMQQIYAIVNQAINRR